MSGLLPPLCLMAYLSCMDITSGLQSSLPYKLKCGLKVTTRLTFCSPSSFWWLCFRALSWIGNTFSTCGGNYHIILKGDWLVMWLILGESNKWKLMEKKNILAAYHYIRSFKITFNSEFMRPRGTLLCMVTFVTCGIKKNTFFHLIVIFHPCEMPHARKEHNSFPAQSKTGATEELQCNVTTASDHFLGGSVNHLQWWFSAYGWAERLNPTTTIKIQINNLVKGLAEDFALHFHTCILSEAACVWFVFSFTAIVIPQPLVIAGRQLQNNESLTTSPIKVFQLQLASPPQQHTLCCLHAGSWKVSQKYCSLSCPKTKQCSHRSQMYLQMLSKALTQ